MRSVTKFSSHTPVRALIKDSTFHKRECHPGGESSEKDFFYVLPPSGGVRECPKSKDWKVTCTMYMCWYLVHINVPRAFTDRSRSNLMTWYVQVRICIVCNIYIRK